MSTDRELLERAREALEIGVEAAADVLNEVIQRYTSPDGKLVDYRNRCTNAQNDLATIKAALADIDAHLKEPERKGVHPVVHEILQRECDRLINQRDAALAHLKGSVQDERKALAEECKRLADDLQERSLCITLEKLHTAIDRLAAIPQPVEQALTVEQLQVILREDGFVTRDQSWTLAGKVHAAIGKGSK